MEVAKNHMAINAGGGELATIPPSTPRCFIKQDTWVQPQHPTSSPIPCPVACWCNTGGSPSAKV